MKKCFFICLIIVCCQITHAKAVLNNCVGIVQQDLKTGLSKNYFLNIQSNGTYQCDKQDIDCSPMLIKDLTKNFEDDTWASTINNNIEFLNNSGFYFDQYNLALDYAHSLFIAVFLAKDTLGHDLTFYGNVLTINFPKVQQFEVGAYPRGLLRPIGYMFIQDKITKVTIEKRQGKITQATFTTDKNEKFQYRLTYQENSLIQSETLFQKSPHLPWQVDSAVSYHYKACQID